MQLFVLTRPKNGILPAVYIYSWGEQLKTKHGSAEEKVILVGKDHTTGSREPEVQIYRTIINSYPPLSLTLLVYTTQAE
mgnify:CR=1 FL=1